MNQKLVNTTLQYNRHSVAGKTLTISSKLPMTIDDAWERVQRSDLLEYVTKGLIKFLPVEKKFPEYWEEGMEVKARMLFFGIIPIGGVHVLNFVKIDSKRYELITNEYDDAAKIWNHRISLTDLKGSKDILYKDEVVIYGGIMTPIITWWAKLFYQYRQKRWLKIALKKEKRTHNKA